MSPLAPAVFSPSQLNADQRVRAWAAATSKVFDVVVIGGGVTGAGAALDAASRGLSVVLVEAADLASGTSSRSGKTFHGGLRYLEQFNLKLVSSALRERDLMVKTICPHLTSVEPFLYPLTHHWERPYVGAGVGLYDLMAARRHTVPHHRHFTRSGALRHAPALDPGAITGAIQYFDVRVDDARHTMTLARTAAKFGAEILTRARVVAMQHEGGRVSGVTVEDVITGKQHNISGRTTINAAGIWSAEMQQLGAAPTFSIRAAKGVHLVFDAGAVDSDTGILARAEDSVLVIRRWWDQWIVGTTDTPWDGDKGKPVASADDIDYLLRNTNKYLRRKLTRSDIVGIYAGLRPLVAPASGNVSNTSALSRDHVVIAEPPGLVTIVGGKYTTYRVMAADAVDLAARDLGADVPKSATQEIPLVGAAGWQGTRRRAPALARMFDMPVAQIERMLGRYGDQIDDVLTPAMSAPALSRPIEGSDSYIGAELVYAVTHEGAMTLDDVMSRRTHLAIEISAGGAVAALPVARILAQHLGWSDAETASQVDSYLAGVRTDRIAL